MKFGKHNRQPALSPAVMVAKRDDVTAGDFRMAARTLVDAAGVLDTLATAIEQCDVALAEATLAALTPALNRAAVTLTDIGNRMQAMKAR